MSFFLKLVATLAAAGLLGITTVVQAAPSDSVEVTVKLVSLPGPYAVATVTIRNNSVNNFGTRADIVTYQADKRVKTNFTVIPSNVHLLDKANKPHWFTRLEPGKAKRAIFTIKYDDTKRFCFEVKTANTIVGRPAGGLAKGRDCLAANK